MNRKNSVRGDADRQIEDPPQKIAGQEQADGVLAEDAEVDEFAVPDDAEVSAELDEFDDDVPDDGEGAEDVEPVVELTSKEQSARSLEIRRAIERRMEKRQLKEDLDYLDLDD